MKKITATLCLLLPALVAAFAQKTSIRVEAPNLVSSDEQFNVTFIIEGENAPSGFEWSPGDAFSVVWGPQKGSSTSVSIVNGKRSKSSQTTYTYVLMPRSAGTFSIPPAVATVKGEKISSSPRTVEVVSGGAASGGSASSSGNERESSQSRVSREDIFMKLTLSKTDVVVGETINATLKLYQRVNIAGFEDARFPSFTGFWSQEVQAPTNIEFKRENVGDMIYNAAVLRSYVLIAQQAGDLTIDPAELVCLVNVRNPSASSGSIFDSFFQDDYRTIRKRVSTKPVTVRVSALPAGAPASFGGGVGSFRMNASLTRDSLAAHDAASLKISITGTGNVSLLEAPKVSFPPDFERYDVKVSESGRTKTFEYPFIPRSHGDFTIGPVEYSYYDVSTCKYVTLRSAELPLRVSRGSDPAPAVTDGRIVQAPVARDVRNLGDDIRYISTRLPRFRQGDRFFAGSALFWILLILTVGLSVLACLIGRRMIKEKADVRLARRKGAGTLARKRLAKASVFLEKNLYSAFYEELHNALLGFISDRLALDRSGLDKENIASAMSSAGVSEDLCSEFTEMLNVCEYARFSPSDNGDGMKSHYDKSVELISGIDEQMKRKSKSRTLPAVVAFLFLSSPAAFSAGSSPVDSLWNAGVAAYAAQQWQDAVTAWETIASYGLESADLECNIGDAWFKQGELGKSVLHYERALRLNPAHQDAKYNLEFVSTLLQDRIDSVPEFFLRSWFRDARRSLSSGLWAWMTLLFVALTCVAAVIFFLTRRVSMRKIAFFASIPSLLLAVMCLSFSLKQKADFLGSTDAVVMRPVSSVKSAPGEGMAKDLLILHEGTRVKVLEEVGEWDNIRLPDGRQGWIAKKDIEII